MRTTTPELLAALGSSAAAADPDGPSLDLADLSVSSLNDGRYRRSAGVGPDGSRTFRRTTVLNGKDGGSGATPGAPRDGVNAIAHG